MKLFNPLSKAKEVIGSIASFIATPFTAMSNYFFPKKIDRAERVKPIMGTFPLDNPRPKIMGTTAHIQPALKAVEAKKPQEDELKKSLDELDDLFNQLENEEKKTNKLFAEYSKGITSDNFDKDDKEILNRYKKIQEGTKTLIEDLEKLEKPVTRMRR